MLVGIILNNKVDKEEPKKVLPETTETTQVEEKPKKGRRKTVKEE